MHIKIRTCRLGPAGQLQGMFVILIVIYELAMYGTLVLLFNFRGVECFMDSYL